MKSLATFPLKTNKHVRSPPLCANVQIWHLAHLVLKEQIRNKLNDYLQILLAQGLFRTLFPGLFARHWFCHLSTENTVRYLQGISTCPHALRQNRYVCVSRSGPP